MGPSDGLSAVLLAAGLSRRMGRRNKLLLELDGEPLIRRTARRLLACEWVELVVVTGFEADRVTAALEGLDLRHVHNPDYEQGQKTSVRAGLAALSRPTSGIAICLGDLAAMQPADYQLLQKAWRERGKADVLIPYYRGQRGNPTILAPAYAQAPATGQSAPGSRAFIDANTANSEVVEMPNDHVLRDIDRPEDYAEHGGLAAPDDGDDSEN